MKKLLYKYKILNKWTRDGENGPDGCCSCNEDFNGINYGSIELDKNMRVNIHLCDNCLEKIRGEKR